MAFKTIDIDKFGYANIKTPYGCIDYNSDLSEADFIGKNRKILLRLKSKHEGWANDVAREIFHETPHLIRVEY